MPPITEWSQAIRRSSLESSAGRVRQKLAQCGLEEQDVAAALKWARKSNQDQAAE
jgi:SOS response regulatory protein OraA/RecX